MPGNSVGKKKRRKEDSTNVILIIAITSLMVIIPILLFVVSSPRPASIHNIESYRNIPGITASDIQDIERLKSGRTHFTYAQMLETEAFVLSDGTYAGFAVEFCDLLSELFGIDFIFEHQQSDALLRGIDSMQIDFTGDFSPAEERSRDYFMTQPIAGRSQRLFMLAGNDTIMTERDVTGLKIGYLGYTDDARRIAELYPESGITFIAAENTSAAAGMIRSGEIDAFTSAYVLDPYFAPYGFLQSREFFSLMYTPVSMATANPDLLPVINAVDKYLAAGGIDVLHSIYKQCELDYIRYKLERSLEEEEREYLEYSAAGKRPVRIAMQADNYPISFYDNSERQFDGIVVDILAQINELTGIEFEIANSRSAGRQEILGMLRSGDVSMISQLIRGEENEGEFLWADRPNATADFALISKRGYPDLAVSQVARANVGTVRDSVFEKKYNEWFAGNSNLTTYTTQSEALKALESGKVDLLMGSDYLLLMQQSLYGKPEYKINVRFDTPMDSYFGFNINETVLCSLINKTLEYVEAGRIAEDWTSRGYDNTSDMNRQRTIVITMVVVLVLALALILALLFNSKLQNLVYMHGNRQKPESLKSGPPAADGSVIAAPGPQSPEDSDITTSEPPAADDSVIEPPGPQSPEDSDITTSGPPAADDSVIEPPGPQSPEDSEIATSGPPAADDSVIEPPGPQSHEGSEIATSGPPAADDSVIAAPGPQSPEPEPAPGPAHPELPPLKPLEPLPFDF